MAEHIQRKTDEDTANIPLWYGEPAKDSFKLADYTAKIDAAQNLLELDEATTFRYFERSLRGSALSWLHTWMIENRAAPLQWSTVKPAFRANFGDTTSAATFAQDIFMSNLDTFGGDFHKFYSHIARLVELHCEPFLAAQVDLGEDHGFTAAQRRHIAQIAIDCYRKVHDKFTLEFFLNGLPKKMFEKVANKPELTKPSQIIDYLKKCDMIARKNTVVPPTTQQPTTASVTPAPVAQEPVEANSTYNTSLPNRGSASTSTRGRFNNYQGRGNFNNSAQNKTANQNRKTTFCIYCRKPNHEQEKCYSRIRDNQPCVSPNGNPYWPKNVNVNAAAPPAAKKEEEKEQSAFSVFHKEVL